MRRWNPSSHRRKIGNALLTSPKRLKGLRRSVSGRSMPSKVVNTIRCLRIPKSSIPTVMCMQLGNTSNTHTCNISITGCSHLLLISECAWTLTWRNLYNRCIRTMQTTTAQATTRLSQTCHKAKITTKSSTKSNICQILISSHQSKGVVKKDSIKSKLPDDLKS